MLSAIRCPPQYHSNTRRARQALRRAARAACAVALSLALAACSGGSSNGDPSPPASRPPPPPVTSPGTLSLSAAAYEVDESSTTANFMVTRTGGSSGTVSVDISTSDDTAVSGQDYGSMTTTATFSDGDTQAKTGTFVIFDDAIDEPDETVALTLSAVTGGATLGARSSALVTILDDDPSSHTVGGSVSGLTGSGLVLRNNGGDDLDVAGDGTFSFATLLTSGSAYDVTVSTQPWAPAQSCSVDNGSGVIGTSDVADVQVSCVEVSLQSAIVSRRIALSQRDLLTVREDGADLVVLADSTDTESFAAFAGERIVFRRNTTDGGDLYSIRPDGSDLLALANEANQESFGGVAGAELVVFERQADVHAIGADGTGLVTLAASADDEGFRAIVSAGASERVVYSRTVAGQDDLYTVNLDGTDAIAIANAVDFEEFAGVTPGGRVLFHLISGGQRDLYSVNADGTGLTALSAAAVTDEFVALLDNERVLFQREIAPFQYDLFAVNADGTAQATLAASSDLELFEGLTPSGRVIYRRLDAAGQTDLYAIDDDGTGLSAIAAAPTSEILVGTPPDDRVVFLRYDGANSEFSDLFVVNADGSAEVRLTNTVEPEATTFGVYLAGGRLIFMRELGAQQDLFSIALDGSDERRLTDTPGSELPVGTTSSGGVIYELDDSTGIDLFRIGADGNGAAVLGPTVDQEQLVTIF